AAGRAAFTAVSPPGGEDDGAVSGAARAAAPDALRPRSDQPHLLPGAIRLCADRLGGTGTPRAAVGPDRDGRMLAHVPHDFRDWDPRRAVRGLSGDRRAARRGA